MVRGVLKFLAIVVTALAVVPGGAHLFALPNKIDLAAEPYFIVQGIYRGWALLGIPLFGAMIVNGALAAVLRGRASAFWLATSATIAIATSLVVFFVWTYPANVATHNWTVVPADWRELRQQWEYSHAVNAVITFCALCCVTAAAILDRSPPPDGTPREAGARRART